MIYYIKLIIGCLLIICTCLPLGSCQKEPVLPLSAAQTNSQGIKVTTPPSAEGVEKDYLIPITELDITDFSSCLFFISFIWPIPFLLTIRKIQPTRKKRKIWSCVELCLSLLSAFIIYSFVFNLFYTPMFFGYIAFLLIITYSLLTMAEVVTHKKTE